MPSATKAARMTTNDLATEVLPKPTVSAWAIILAQGELGPNPTGPAFRLLPHRIAERLSWRFMTADRDPPYELAGLRGHIDSANVTQG